MINMLHLGLSYNCNMRCKHCFVNKNMDKLNIQNIKKCIDELYKQGLFVVFFTFGEPLLAPNFEEISNYLKEKEIIQIVMTNGSIINNKLLKILKTNVNRVFVSIDSILPEKHNNNRNYKNAFQKALKTINIMVENNINCGLAVTINDSNVIEMNEISDLANALNVNTISFLRQRTNKNINTLKDVDNYTHFYEDYLTGKIHNNLNIVFHDPLLLSITKKLYKQNKISIDKYEKYTEMNGCNIKNTLSLAPNGDVLLCNLVNKKIGNICDEDISKILEKRSDNCECFICNSEFSG